MAYRRSLLLAAAFAFSELIACSGKHRDIDDHVAAGSSAGGDGSFTDSNGGRAAGSSSSGPADSSGGRPADSSGAAGLAGTGGEDESGGDGATGNPVYVKASNPDAQDYFGETLALAGAWLAVGASHESSRATGVDGDQEDDSEDLSGAVYLFSRNAAGWAQRAYVKASNAGAGDGFGAALSLTEDTLAVGAPHEDSDATGIDASQGNGPGGNQGAVYVFARSAQTWSQEAYIKASNTSDIDLFGTSVALQGNALLVGAPWEDSQSAGIDGEELDASAANSGAVYYYERVAGKWRQAHYVKSKSPKADAEFGAALAISGDTFVVGAPGENSQADGVDPNPSDGGAEDSGAVYAFERSGSTFVQTAFIKAPSAKVNQRFGKHLALDGDTLAVSAIEEEPGSGTASADPLFQSGDVYVFERSAGTWDLVASLKSTTRAEKYYFGHALALRGDTLLVGAFGEGRTLPASGALYIFKRK
jgi:hypothetical protein